MKMKRYAVVQRWKDNPIDVAVIEYATTQKEALEIVARLPKDSMYRYEIGEYT